MKNLRLLTVICAVLTALGLVTSTVSAAGAAELAPNVPNRTQMVIINSDGSVKATPNADQPRPALSLAKLYLGYYVLANGEEADRGLVYNMIRYSEDPSANYLESRYPQALPAVISAFGLTGTATPGFWGNSTTTARDAAEFVSAIRTDPIGQTLIQAMADVAPTAADGYSQNFGTATLAGVTGSKLGWSDNRDVHSSVSTGPGYVVAAITYGTAGVLTTDVHAAVSGTGNPDGNPVEDAMAPGSAEALTSPVIPTGALKQRVRCSVLAPVADLVPEHAPMPSVVLTLVPAC